MYQPFIGAEVIADTNNHTGRFGKVLAMEDTVANFAGPDLKGDFSGMTMKANTSLECIVTSITLQSGSVVAYRI
jgi:hypothetical protein|tara:strand:+ start:152 stop:373 length:222 start_codon:yes stop_codon:yes gene_type:complete